MLQHLTPPPSRKQQPPHRWRGITWGAMLLALTLIAYVPVMWRGGFIWDDPDYVQHNPVIRTLEGLGHIWFDPSSLPQYYPMVHTTYWVEYHLWGLSPTGYHIDNVVLHALSAVLLWRLLKKLAVPGAWAAAAVFAVHPVMVESVAWVTERKNVLSLVFYLGAFLAYLRFAGVPEALAAEAADAGETRERKERARWLWYGAALLLFVLGMFSKTVDFSFPAAVVLVLWWKRGRVKLLDFAYLAPFFAIGAGLGWVTAHLEQVHVGAVGKEWDFTPADRIAIAGRAVWFYVGKLFWPHPLVFIYPKWTIDSHQAWQWVPAAMAVAVAAALVVLSRRIGRGWAVGWLFFIGTLVPALGFFNVYPMRYSFVADHFQYHASIGVIAMAVALVAWVLCGMPRKAGQAVGAAIVVIALGGLASVTWARGYAYQSALKLWRDTAAKNPDSWMVHVNLGHALVAENDLDAAERQYTRAEQLAPEMPEAIINVGGMLSKRGHFQEAIAQYQRALKYRAEYPPALYGIGDALLSEGKPAEAKAWLERAVKADPTYVQAQYKLGVALEKLGDAEGARRAYTAAVASDPEEVDSMYNLANLYRANGRLQEAAAWYQRAIEIRPGQADLHANLAATLWQLGYQREAVEEYKAAARLDPKLAAGIRQFLGQKGIALP